MPSPIAHSVAGYAIYQLFRKRIRPRTSGRIGPFPWLLFVTVGFSMLPDVDAAVGVLSGDFGRFHNNLTHSAFVAAVVALASAAFGSLKGLGRFADWFWLTLLCYGMHILMDAATLGKGVMVFWPITDERFMTPVPVFYGFHWSDGWLNRRHWWTVTTELGFAALILLIYRHRSDEIGQRR